MPRVARFSSVVGVCVLVLVGMLAGSIVAQDWELVQPLPTPRQGHRAVGTSDAVYVFGGNTGGSSTSGFTNVAYKFSESSGSWTSIAPMPAALGHMGMAVLENDIYVIGGASPSFPQSVLTGVYKYSTTNDSWQTVASLNLPRRDLPCVALNGYIYAVGGTIDSWSVGTATNVVERYDPNADSWSLVSPLPVPMRPAVAASINGYIYAIGGNGPHAYEGYRYDPTTDAWTQLADPVPFYTESSNQSWSQEVTGHSLIMLISIQLTQAAIYDPGLDTWSVFPNVVNEPREHGNYALAVTSTYLYLMGGVAAGYIQLDTAERTPLGGSPLVIDIKPGSDPNAINLKSKGMIAVAILTTDDFDAATVDTETIEFEGASPVHDGGHLEDVDGDGDIDWVGHFKVQETDVVAGDTEATITGQTLDGTSISGTDSVKIVGAKPAPSLNATRKLTTTWARVKSR